jgi:two-component SAPR family response regulator
MTRKPKIFIYSEEYEILSSLYISLVLSDYDVEATNDPAEVSHRMNRLQPDLVLLNPKLSSLTHHALYEQVKAQQNVRIMLVGCSHCLQQARQKGLQADEYLEQPVQRQKLEEKLDLLLKRA